MWLSVECLIIHMDYVAAPKLKPSLQVAKLVKAIVKILKLKPEISMVNSLDVFMSVWRNGHQNQILAVFPQLWEIEKHAINGTNFLWRNV